MVEEQLSAFRDWLPDDEAGLAALGRHTRARAYLVLFRIERCYEGLEMLKGNEPPLIFWGADDIERRIDEMDLSGADREVFREEFINYQLHFRSLVEANKKRYVVVLNQPTLELFLQRKESRERGALIELMRDYAQREVFTMVVLRPNGTAASAGAPRPNECEILCKTMTPPRSCKGMIAIGVYDDAEGEYYILPHPEDTLYQVRKERDEIEAALRAAEDQYAADLEVQEGRLSPRQVRNHTAALLQRMKG